MKARCFLILLLVACSRKGGTPAPSLATGVPLSPQRQANMDNSFFFPEGSLAPTNARWNEDEFRRTWYSKHLHAMQEPSLSRTTVSGDSFRFLWLRTFHAPIAVRVDVTTNGSKITAVRLSGAGGYDPGTIADRSTHDLPIADLESLRAAFQTAKFWELAPWERASGTDGSQWIVEARSGSSYRVVDRWSPTEGPFHNLGVCFLKLAGVKVEPRDVY